MNWEQALQQADTGNILETDPPKRSNIVYVYQKGECVGVVTGTLHEAKFKFGDAFVYEVCTDNETEIRAYWEALRAVQDRAFDIWFEDLKHKWRELRQGLFELCYVQAYDRGHSAGYDDVAGHMYDVVAFAKQILEIKERP